MRRAAAFAAVFGAALAWGYVLSGAKWSPGSNVAFFVNANTADTAFELDAVQGALSTWSGVNPSGLRLSYGGPSSAVDVGYNGTNTVCWQNQGATSTLATSYWWYSGGRILESDIVFNDYHGWATTGADYDIETVALHELGHSIGLLHSSTGIMGAYYGGIQRSLDPDALAGFAAMYGSTVDLPPRVSFLVPAAGAVVSGLVSMTATATDDRGVVRVEFFAADTKVAVDTASPYAVQWDSSAFWNGRHGLRAVAVDTVGQTGEARVDVLLAPHAPTGLAGLKKNNSSPLQEQYINVLTWLANEWNRDIKAYRVYVFDGGQWSLLAELDAGTFDYRHTNVPRASVLRYRVLAVDTGDVEGEAAEVEVR